MTAEASARGISDNVQGAHGGGQGVTAQSLDVLMHVGDHLLELRDLTHRLGCGVVTDLIDQAQRAVYVEVVRLSQQHSSMRRP